MGNQPLVSRVKVKEMAKEVSWEEAISKYFAKVELCAYFEILRATPAIEFKKRAMNKVIKQLKALEEE